MALEPWREQLPSTQSPWPSGHECHWGARPPCTDRMRKNEAVDGWLSERPGSELFGDRGSGKLRLAASLSSDLAAAWLCADGSSEPVASDRWGVGKPGPTLQVSSRAAQSNGQRLWLAAQRTVICWRRFDGPQLQESLNHGCPEVELRLAGPLRESPR